MMERKNDDMTSKLIRLNKSIAIINVTLHLSDIYMYMLIKVNITLKKQTSK